MRRFVFFVIFKFGMGGLTYIWQSTLLSHPQLCHFVSYINSGSALKDKMCAGEGDIGTWGKGRHLSYSCFNISFLLVMFRFVLDCP